MIQHRDYSTIQRQTIAGQVCYTKKCLPGCRYDTPELVREQIAREVEILDRAAHISEFSNRLGVVKVVDHDLANSLIRTAEVPGELLSDVLRHASRKKLRGTCVRALYLAGKWLRYFQKLQLSQDMPTSTPGNPADLVEHCRLRLEILTELGEPWPSPSDRDRLLFWVRKQIGASSLEHQKRIISHADYGPYNMIWDDRKLTPIDFAAFAMDFPLADISYLIHRLEMMPIEIPWRRWPVSLWRKACLRGYGTPDAERLPIYNALMVRWLLSRLKKLAERKSTTSHEWRRNKWRRYWVRTRLLKLVEGPQTLSDCSRSEENTV